jgi:outer membrane immunogenic protein
MIKVALVGAVAFSVVSASIASAADLPPRPAPPPLIARAPVIVEAGFSWTGCYVGVHGGYGWGKKTFTDDEGFELTNHDVKGGLAGGQLGCNYQAGAFVFGVEGQASWTGLEGSSSLGNIDLDDDTPGNQFGTMHTKVQGLGSIAARLGFAIDRTLIYGKVGGAFARDKHWLTLDNSGVTVATADGNTRWGWMAGAGVEYAFLPNWSVKVEYNYMGLGKKSPEFCDSSDCFSDVSIKQNIQVVKAGVNFRFSGGGVVASY